MKPQDYFKTRFQPHKARTQVWKELVRFIERDIGNPGVVLELGPGYGDFINTINATRKIAIDHNAEVSQFLNDNIEFYEKDCTDLSFLSDNSVDTVFASNLLEHIGRDAIQHLLQEIHRVLKKNGQCIFLQPNFRYCYREYFDDYTHVSIFTHIGLSDLLCASGFSIKRCIPGLLPLSMKSRLPKHPLLVRLYLNLPYRPLAKQMYIVGRAN
ncbi:MAG: class I SAM-dependent methyltransferase [gamma proteobacterium symbiont of Taylorina sp.]|nr:class I SAM-dependent methyltransferase [gamma proteobacterium symbiont of Taylorina sp.]